MTAITKLYEYASTLQHIAMGYPVSNVSEQTLEEFCNRCEEQAVQVMLFGSYNAGKSSLINALVGQSVAAEGVIPLTSKPNLYPWQNCLLMDTPGVNAPIEHEAVTAAQLARCELVLFVIRAGDQDVQDVYSRMMAMLSQGKQIFIVFNHELDDAGLAESIERLNSVLLTQAEREGLSTDRVMNIPVMPMNIKTAQRGNEKQSDTLRAHSGMVAFEQRFLAWLEALDNEQQYLDRYKKLLQHLMIEPLLDAINEQTTASNDQQLIRLGRQRDDIASTLRRLEGCVRLFTRGEVNKRKPTLRDILASADSAADVNAGVQAVAESIAEQVNGYLKTEVDSAFAAIRVALEGVPGLAGDEEQENGIVDVVEKITLMGVRRVGPAELKEAFVFLRKMKVPYFKGRWEKTLGSWAGKAAPLLQAAVALYDVYSANKEQEKLNKAQQHQAMKMHAALEEIADAIFNQITSAVSESLQSTRTAMLEGLEAEIAQLTSRASQTVQDLSTVSRIASDVKNLTLH